MSQAVQDTKAVSAAQEPIAIVGIGCVYPKAEDKGAYWRNILGKVDAVSEAPDDWRRWGNITAI